jgi:hypothetical protein
MVYARTNSIYRPREGETFGFSAGKETRATPFPLKMNPFSKCRETIGARVLVAPLTKNLAVGKPIMTTNSLRRDVISFPPVLGLMVAHGNEIG